MPGLLISVMTPCALLTLSYGCSSVCNGGHLQQVETNNVQNEPAVARMVPSGHAAQQQQYEVSGAAAAEAVGTADQNDQHGLAIPASPSNSIVHPSEAHAVQQQVVADGVNQPQHHQQQQQQGNELLMWISNSAGAEFAQVKS